MTLSIQYNSAPLNDFKVLETADGGTVTVMSIAGQPVHPTPRFWTSLCSGYSNYGLSTKLFKLFTHAEVFQRISDVAGADGRDRLRFALEDKGAGNPRLLAVTNPTKPLVEYPRMQEQLALYGATGAVDHQGKVGAAPEYKDGIIRSTHTPSNMDDRTIAGDGFSHQYVMETPIDGFGKPLIYLSLLRQVCTNGMIGYSRAFRTEINLGRGTEGVGGADVMFSISRALDSFSNEEGYAALAQRFESATNSWASVYEVNRILKVVNKMATSGMFTIPTRETGGTIDNLALKRDSVLGAQLSLEPEDKTPSNPVNIKLQRAFTELVGPLTEIYGIAHLDAVSQKKMAKIPARCTMYELLNFVTEVATHYCDEKNGRLLQAEVGNFVSAEYDLEGTCETHPNFTDFFTNLEDETNPDLER